MEEKSREVVMAISNAARYMDPFFKLSAMGTVLLLQYFARMVKERKLKETEFTDFQKFLRMTEGKYDIMNVPEIPEEQLSEELNSLGIHYMILPDLEKNDGMLQVAVYQPDRENFGAWYQRYILSRMTGGEKDIQELRNLTSGKTTIVSFPLEDEEELIREDFEKLGINYSRLPDLHVGDGELQVVIANADLPKVESWYKLYQDDLRKDGITDAPDMKKMSMDNYMQTGQQTEAEYIDTASPELKAVNAKYESKEKGEIEHQIEAAEHNTMRKESSTAYLRYVNDPSYIPVSIDKKTLVEKSSVINKDGLDRYNQFACRIPGTYGKNEKQLVIPETQVFETQKGSYIAFLNKEEPVFVFNVRTKQVDHEMRKLTGEEFAKQYFDKVDRPSERKVTSLKKYKEKGKDLSDLKIKMPDPPIRSK